MLASKTQHAPELLPSNNYHITTTTELLVKILLNPPPFSQFARIDVKGEFAHEVYQTLTLTQFAHEVYQKLRQVQQERETRGHLPSGSPISGRLVILDTPQSLLNY
jgi:hypothetical protein